METTAQMLANKPNKKLDFGIQKIKGGQ